MEPHPPPIGVLVVDDHEQFVHVLEAVLGPEPDLKLVGRATNGQEAVDAANLLAPDVVLMDISMPVLDGLEATRRILAGHPEMDVVMLTGSSSDEDRLAAREVGAVAYVTKERILEELADAVRSAANDHRLS